MELNGNGRPLSPRERQALKLMAEGHTRKAMALAMHCSQKTVEYFFHGNAKGRSLGIYRKVGTDSVALLTQWALRQGIADWAI